MFDYCIYNQLKKGTKATKSFHMPGHKASGDFKKKFQDAVLDVTELSYSDNLHCPTGAIKKAQADLAKILKAQKTYITTDGSSSGVMALVYSASKKGNKLIVFRNSHQSVWNACRLFGVEPLIVQSKEKDGVLQPPDCEIIERLIANDPHIAGVLATSPDYYGNIAPLEKYSEIVKKHGRLLLVDEAHGAYLAFGHSGYAGLYADAWVDGAHKTLSTLSQGAVVSVNNEELILAIEEALSIFRTTSPSYPIMASVEYGIKSVANRPKIIKEAKSAIEKFKKEETKLTFYKNDDWTKLLVDFRPLSMNPELVLKALENKGVFAEFTDGRYILFYLSVNTTQKELKKLRKVLHSITSDKRLRRTYHEKPEIPVGERSYSFLYALKKQHEWVELEKCAGRMCAQNVGVTPPCIPLAVTGEIITEETIKILLQSQHNFGMRNGMICVVKK